MHPTVEANHQHRNDNLTGRWTKNNRNTYENFDGYQLHRVTNRTGGTLGWRVILPNGTPMLNDQRYYRTLIIAKYEADEHNQNAS